jgi:hypothetical protein
MMLRLPWSLAALLVAAGGLVLCPAQEVILIPRGVEVLARGPVHEAYASPTTEPVVTKTVPRKPPAPIMELPPEQKPAGDCVWISGYWAYDDDRRDFLWVSGVWRVPPPSETKPDGTVVCKQWVPGYWRMEGFDWQWVPGFWTSLKKAGEQQQVVYLPEPPVAPAQVLPPKPIIEDSFYVPGCRVWTGSTYDWRAGYWARMQPGLVWVPDHYRWTPSGYIFVEGYWDQTLKNRGILFAPVYVSPAVVTAGFVYTPAYAVRDTIIVNAMFVRPTVCHYYFGDYYGSAYADLGYESCVVYSQRNYDSIIVYERCERRAEPNWINVQLNLSNDRSAGRADPPPRTLAQQQTIINNTTVVNNNYTIATVNQVAVTKNTTMVNIDNSTRMQARAQAVAIQQVADQRGTTEVKTPPGAPRQPRVASLNVPRAQPVKKDMVVPKMPSLPAGMVRSPVTEHPGADKAPTGTGKTPAGGGHGTGSSQTSTSGKGHQGTTSTGGTTNPVPKPLPIDGKRPANSQMNPVGGHPGTQGKEQPVRRPTKEKDKR